MSTPDLFSAPQSKVIVKTVPTSLVDKLAAFFEAHPEQWIDGMALAKIAGQYAWRSRVSDLRKRGMTIENRQREVNVSACAVQHVTISEYRYMPEWRH